MKTHNNHNHHTSAPARIFSKSLLTSVLCPLAPVLCLLALAAAAPRANAATIVKVSSGGHVSLYLTDDGRLYGIGYNDDAQLGGLNGNIPPLAKQRTPVLILQPVFDQ